MDGLLELVLGASIFVLMGLLCFLATSSLADLTESKTMRILINCLGVSTAVIVWGAGLVFFCVKFSAFIKLIL